MIVMLVTMIIMTIPVVSIGAVPTEGVRSIDTLVLKYRIKVVKILTEVNGL